MTLSTVVFETVATGVRVVSGLATVAASSPAPYRGAQRPLREAVGDTSRRVSQRVARGAARSVGSAAGEAIPFAGVAVVVAATAWDLYDACETMSDLAELAAAVDPGATVDPNTVCGMAAPTPDQLLDVIVAGGASTIADAWAAIGGEPPVRNGDGS